MADLILTPELLMQQSAEMINLQGEYETLFKNVNTSLSGINESWSENLAKNFSGKIQMAQGSFSSVTNMFANGGNAAGSVARTFENGISASQALNTAIGDTMKPPYGYTAGGGGYAIGGGGKGAFGGGGNDSEEYMRKIAEAKGIDYETLTKIKQAIKTGDYEKAVELSFDKGIDWVAENMSNGPEAGSWVDVLNKATGGKLGFATLEKDFFKNWFSEPIKDAVEIVKNEYSGNPDYEFQAKKLGEFAWHFGPGAALKTAGDTSWNFVKDIPYIGDFYKERGVTDAEGAFSTAYSEIVYAITGDTEAKDYYRNYYSSHGGVAKGIVDGVTDIASYVWDNGFKSIFNK